MKVQQALHGYADGHRMLASSTSLAPRDAKTVLVMSDASAPSSQLREEGYITGYPLTDSGLYAFARTWPAREMPRPGCVWTHTLLVDFADLAILENPGILCALFARPESRASFSGYSLPLVFTADAGSGVEPVCASRPWGKRVLFSLYGSPSEKAFVALPSDVSAEALIIAIWSQQWPRLRRNFRFCSFIQEDRSTDYGSFDLQIIGGGDKGVRTRVPHAVASERIEQQVGPWLEHAASDLVSPNGLGLRTFFRTTGVEVKGGREVFAALCRLHQLTSGTEVDPDVISSAIRLLKEELEGASLKKVRKRLVEAAAGQADRLDVDGFEFLVNHLDEAELGSAKESAAVGIAILRRDPKIFAEMIEAGGARAIVAASTLQFATKAELLDGLTVAPSMRADVVSVRPEVLGCPAFWLHGAPEIDGYMSSALSEPQKADMVAAMIASGTTVLAESAVRRLGAQMVLRGISVQWMSQINTPRNHRIEIWLREAARDMAGVGEFLGRCGGQPIGLLVAIASVTKPNSVPVSGKRDPWLVAIDAATGDVPQSQREWLAAYLFSRALASLSASSGELAARSFSVIHKAAERSALDECAWRVVVERLPRVPFWADWDRCKRLRAALVRLFVDNDLDPRIFGELPVEEYIFEYLVAEAAEWSKGRRFLRSVREVLKQIDGVGGRRSVIKAYV